MEVLDQEVGMARLERLVRVMGPAAVAEGVGVEEEDLLPCWRGGRGWMRGFCTTWSPSAGCSPVRWRRRGMPGVPWCQGWVGVHVVALEALRLVGARWLTRLMEVSGPVGCGRLTLRRTTGVT